MAGAGGRLRLFDSLGVCFFRSVVLRNFDVILIDRFDVWDLEWFLWLVILNDTECGFSESGGPL